MRIMYKFLANGNFKMNPGKLIYKKEENSFDFLPSKNADITLLLGYLYVGIDSEMMSVEQVWGFCPFESWYEQKLEYPRAFEGKLFLKEKLDPGMSYKMDGKWTVKYDPESGWVCLGNDAISANDVAIEFAHNSIAVIADSMLKSLWLKPEFE